MPHYLSDEELRSLTPAEIATFRSPVPTQVVSNGEFNPLPQTPEQRQVEARVKGLADELGPRHGMSRRQFLASSAGMAAAFLAMNEVFGSVFEVSRAEAATPGLADARAAKHASQLIVDVQTHFVRDDFKHDGLLDLAKYAKQHWNPALAGEKTLARFKFENYVKEVFVDSDTKVALLSGAPFDDPTWDLLSNDQIAAARSAINRIAGSRRLLAHSVFTPKRAGWLDEVDRCIAQVKPDSWKGYTVGDPLSPSKLGSFWRLDDEKLAYPLYERIVKAGSPIVCIHKGLLPADYEKSWPGVWEYNSVWDVGKAAKDWPQISFIMYHGALRPFLETPEAVMTEFEQTGRIKWATDLAEIPAKYGVTNVYGEIGTAFANCGGEPPLRRGVHGHAPPRARARARAVGHRLGLVRLPPVADRGDAPAGDPRGHAEEARVRPARPRRWRDQERDLRRERRAALRPRGEDRPRQRDRRRPDCRGEGRVRRRRRAAQQRPLRVRPPVDGLTFRPTPPAPLPRSPEEGGQSPAGTLAPVQTVSPGSRRDAHDTHAGLVSDHGRRPSIGQPIPCRITPTPRDVEPNGEITRLVRRLALAAFARPEAPRHLRGVIERHRSSTGIAPRP